MLYILELAEHDEEPGMKWLHKAVMEGKRLNLVEMRAEYEWEDVGKPWCAPLALRKYDGTRKCKATTNGRVYERGAG